MAPIIATTVQWVILPMIMCAIFTFAWIIAGSARTAELRVSSWAGFWAGLLSFVIYVVSQLSQIREPNLHYVALPGLQFLPLGWGLTTGFVFLWIVRHAVPTRWSGSLRSCSPAPARRQSSLTSSSTAYESRSCTGRSAPPWGFSCTSSSFPSSIAHIFPLGERKERFLVDAMRNPMAGLFPSSGATISGAGGPGERSFDSQPQESVAG